MTAGEALRDTRPPACPAAALLSAIFAPLVAAAACRAVRREARGFDYHRAIASRIDADGAGPAANPLLQRR